MGLFGSQETVNISEPGLVATADQVRERVTDAGEYFLSWMAPVLPEQRRTELAALLDSLRTPEGWIPENSLSGVGIRDFKSGPLTFLAAMTARDRICMEVWSSYGLRGDDKRAIERIVSTLLLKQGHGAAATWAVGARPNARLDLEFLDGQLRNGWDEGLKYVRNGDVIKAYKRWVR